MDGIIDLDGRRYPFQGPLPQVGDVVAGFIVRRVAERMVYLAFPATNEEEQAVEAWERTR